mgnify:CR=1 FL=1
MAIQSQYERYWLLLLKDGRLTVQVPTDLVATIKKAIIRRKSNHRWRTGVIFNSMKIVVEEAKTVDGKVLAGKTKLSFHMHNLQTKDI